MLTRIKHRIESPLLVLGKFLADYGFTPNIATVTGFLFAVIAAILYYRGPSFLALSAVSLLLSGLFDVLDGAIARATNSVSKFGGVLDSVLDRAGEMIVYAGIILGGYVDISVGLLALGLSFLVSYSRARVEAEGVGPMAVGIAERPERLIILFAATAARQIQWGLILIIALSAVTLVQRLSYAYGKLRR